MTQPNLDCTTMPYDISSRGYLRRARKLLDTGEREALFHAAFELRCGIQARIEDYLEAQDQIGKAKKQGWRIPKMWKNLQRAFKLERIAEIVIFDQESGKPLLALYYTPVTASLRQKGNQLGVLLHAAQRRYADDHPWWSTTREFLEGVYLDLEKANRGRLLGPLLKRPGSDKVKVRLEFDQGEDPAPVMQILKDHPEHIIKIDYLDDFPK